MKRPLFCLFSGLGLTLVLVTGCGSDQGYTAQQMGYKEMKSMVVDILKTDEGKKAVEEALGGGSSSGESGGASGAKILSAQSGDDIRLAVKDTLVSEDYKKEIEKIMTDPQFAGEFAKAINAESKQLHLQLIKDPTYQKSVEEIMKSPEIMKSFLELTKTPDYRKQTMTIMQEAMQNPLFRMEVLQLLKTVVKDELQPAVEKEQGGESGGGSENGGEAGGEGGSEGESGGGGGEGSGGGS
ncbi:spore gernimation protein [Paenibacillus sp. F411]|uniref:spore germination lipoprotein GerD n=1 Tax=Paenibacillus sp. F411 TaxID=2820239 RepID=UPI001AAE1EAA|nr:spore germination lipoprotein GerD [Paenibacillus sp. F411]MBO2945782.1 spore gernimation protein [Paenibacillus sp. F411]